MTIDYSINTLHRGKYMLSFFALLFLAGGISALIPTKEIIKVIVILFAIPGIIFLSVKFSQRPSKWTVTANNLTVSFVDTTYQFDWNEIDHIRSLSRSGGTLYVIYFKKKSPVRFWRNKLFQAVDDQIALETHLKDSEREFYKF